MKYSVNEDFLRIVVSIGLILFILYSIPWVSILNPPDRMHYNPHNPLWKKTLLDEMRSTKTTETFFTKPIFIVFHEAGSTREKYFSYNGNPELDDCKEAFVMFNDKEYIKCFLGYKYETQFYLMEITGIEQRQIAKKLLDDGLFELSNLLDRTDLKGRREGNRHTIRNTKKDYTLIDYIGIFQRDVGAINKGTDQDNAMIEGFANYMKITFLQRIKNEEHKVENWSPYIDYWGYLG